MIADLLLPRHSPPLLNCSNMLIALCIARLGKDCRFIRRDNHRRILLLGGDRLINRIAVIRAIGDKRVEAGENLR